MTSQRKKNVQKAREIGCPDADSICSFADGAAYGRRDAAKQLRLAYGDRSWDAVVALITKWERDK